jgi:hypothetical protein
MKELLARTAGNSDREKGWVNTRMSENGGDTVDRHLKGGPKKEAKNLKLNLIN